MHHHPGPRPHIPVAACLIAPVCLLALLAGSACQSKRPDNGRSIVMVVVDALRADHLGTYRYHRHTSPALDELAQGGALFEHAIAASPWTLPSFATLFTGQVPSRHGAGRRLSPGNRHRVGALDPTVPVLAELLGERGYHTAAFLTNSYLHENFGVARGFETYRCTPASNQHFQRAVIAVTSAFEWLDGLDERPFFLLLHFFEPHLDYHAGPGARGRFTGGYEGPLALPIRDLHQIRRGQAAMGEDDRDFVRAAYDEEILVVDRQLDRFFEGLNERGVAEDAIVVFTSDHGEEFFEHGGFEHGHAVYQELLHVPLVFWGPGIRPARIEAPVSHLDVFPTLADALGLPVPDDLPGISLWPHMTRGDAIPERGIVAEGTLYGPPKQALIRWPWKLIRTGKTGRIELFDLDRDPGEQRNLAGELRGRAGEMKRELSHRVSSALAGLREEIEAEIDSRTREHLKSLGYLE